MRLSSMMSHNHLPLILKVLSIFILQHIVIKIIEKRDKRREIVRKNGMVQYDITNLILHI